MSIEAIKKAVGEVAASLVESKMTIGLGSGTTAHHFIQSLIARCQKGLSISAVASSKESQLLAKKGGIPLLEINAVSHLDLTIDGADQIDHEKQMIKGKGGALVREKILAHMSRELIVIVDETKLVPHLGKGILPVEIIPFGIRATEHHLEKLGYSGKWRKIDQHIFYTTDNGNYILDIHLEIESNDPRSAHEKISNVPGVVDTGFFFDVVGRVIVGFFDGQVVMRS